MRFRKPINKLYHYTLQFIETHYQYYIVILPYQLIITFHSVENDQTHARKRTIVLLVKLVKYFKDFGIEFVNVDEVVDSIKL